MLRRGIVAVLVCLGFAARVMAQCEAGWLPGFPTPYIGGGSINAMMTHDPDGDGPLSERLVIAGGFTNVEGFSCNRFAVWDGSTWQSAATISTLLPQALAEYNSEIVAGGNGVSRLVGNGWVAIPSAPSSVLAMRQFEGDLYVGGSFASSSGPSVVARWNGSAWSGLGAGVGGTSRVVNALLATEAGLVVTGSFATAGGSPSQSAAIWTGNAWISTPGLPAEFTGYGLVEHLGEVFVCGGTYVNEQATVYRLDGTAWVGVARPSFGNTVQLVSFNGELYAVASTQYSLPLHRWTGSSWEQMPDTGGMGVRGTSPHKGVVVFGSDVIFASGPLMKWNPAEAYRTMAIGPNSIVIDAEEFNGDVIVTGNFTIAGGKKCNGIARFDGTTFHPMGQGIRTDQGGAGYDLQVFNDELYVCGDLWAPYAGVAKWNGEAWVRTVASGSHPGPPMYKMCVHDSALYVAGFVGYVGRFNGSTWSSVGPVPANSPLAMASHANALYVAGHVWDGTTWQRLLPPSGSWPTEVRGYVTHNDDLYLLGLFGNLGGGVGRVEGTSIVQVPGNLSGYASAGQIVGGSLESYNGDLIAARFFYPVGQLPTGVVRHDGIRWSLLAGGVRGGSPPVPGTYGYANFAKNINDTLWVGGYFSHAGGQPSPYLARYRASAGPSITEQPVAVDVCISTDAVLQAAHDQTTEFEVRWRRNREPLEEGVALANGTVPIGVATTTLTLQGVQPGDEGEFDFVVTTLCGTEISDRVQVNVLDAGNDACRQCPSCPADYDQDGGVTGSDIGAFFIAYEQGEACADVDLDGGMTGADIGAFFLAYEAGGC